MSSEENRAWDGVQEPAAGPETFERSENVSGPARPAGTPGVPDPVPESSGLGSAEVWEDAWPTSAADTEADEATDVWEDEPLPVRKTRRRGTFSPPVERPRVATRRHSRSCCCWIPGSGAGCRRETLARW